MVFTIYNYQIKQIEYGWLAQKRVGNQWKDNSYYPSLGQATNYIFEQQLGRTTKQEKINLGDVQRCNEQIDRVIERMNLIRDEIIGVLHG